MDLLHNSGRLRADAVLLLLCRHHRAVEHRRVALCRSQLRLCLHLLFHQRLQRLRSRETSQGVM